MGKGKRLREARALSISNGNSDPSIPPDLVWDENDPPIVFSCSQHTEHAPRCDGSCEAKVCDESLVNLLNEARAYARAGMSFNGIPAAMSGGPWSGLNVEIYDLEVRTLLLQNIIQEQFGISDDDINRQFRELKYKLLHDVRIAVEPDIKRARLEAQVGVQKSRIVGPHGELL